MKNDFSAFSYYMPTKIIFGNDKLSTINQYIGNRKTLLVTSNGAIKRGLIERVNSFTPHIISIITEIASHPEINDLKSIYHKQLQHLDYELILAIGGGSVLDSAKCFAVKGKEKSFKPIENLIRGINQNKAELSVTPVISIPTTAGTGSELTPWGTVWDNDIKKKHSIYLPNLFNEVAIYDPQLTLSVPESITLQTGLDTLSHALESIWNKNASPITENYAIQAIQLIIEYLPKLQRHLTNISYREKIMRACMLAGLAFSNTKTAIAHAMSYYITAHKKIPHGLACSFTLPMIVKAAEKKMEIYSLLQQALGNNAYDNLCCFFQSLGIKTHYQDYGLEISDLDQIQSTLNNNDRALNSIIEFQDLNWNPS